MKNLKRTLAIVSSLLIIASCSKEDDRATSANGWGTTSFECSMRSDVGQITRTDNLFYIPESLIPSASDILLKIKGSYIDPENSELTQYSYGPLLLSDYQTSLPKMIASADYHATFVWGEEGTEGETAPYFGGAIDFEVIARGKTTENVSLVLQNSIIAVEFDDIFSSYYTDAEFTVTTESGNSFDFSASTLDKIVFVEAATELTLSGTATKRRDGTPVTFNATSIGQTKAQTLSRINITADSIGGENINITLDETITEMEPVIIELNPQGN